VGESSVEHSRIPWIGLLALGVALAAMVVDHLLGTEPDAGESGLADPATFAVSAVLTLAAASFLFGWLVPRVRRQGAERAASVGLVSSVVSAVPGIVLLWLGFPYVCAGAGAQLGRDGRRGARSGRALAAVVVGTAILLFGIAFVIYGVVISIA
jgi:hypothetical protein